MCARVWNNAGALWTRTYRSAKFRSDKGCSSWSSSTMPLLAACASMLAPLLAGVTRPDVVVDMIMLPGSSPTSVGRALAICCDPAPLAGVLLPVAADAGDSRTLGTARSLLPPGLSSPAPTPAIAAIAA